MWSDFMWNDLEYGFQIAFNNAWEAYKSNTIPIGVVILDRNNNIMSIGKNQIHSDGDGLIKFHQLAHAEANAILKLSEIKDINIHKNIRTFTLYSTMEPCPFCFGAIVMGSIRNLKFASRDSWAGATALNNTINYIKNKNISVHGPFEETELVQIAMQTCYEMETGRKCESLLTSWSEFCPKGVQIGKVLFEECILKNMLSMKFCDVYDYICNIRL
jgi:tRNA(adenine34) deaminase